MLLILSIHLEQNLNLKLQVGLLFPNPLRPLTLMKPKLWYFVPSSKIHTSIVFCDMGGELSIMWMMFSAHQWGLGAGPWHSNHTTAILAKMAVNYAGGLVVSLQYVGRVYYVIPYHTVPKPCVIPFSTNVCTIPYQSPVSYHSLPWCVPYRTKALCHTILYQGVYHTIPYQGPVSYHSLPSTIPYQGVYHTKVCTVPRPCDIPCTVSWPVPSVSFQCMASSAMMDQRWWTTQDLGTRRVRPSSPSLVSSFPRQQGFLPESTWVVISATHQKISRLERSQLWESGWWWLREIVEKHKLNLGMVKNEGIWDINSIYQLKTCFSFFA